jgi:hypothetical protein
VTGRRSAAISPTAANGIIWAIMLAATIAFAVLSNCGSPKIAVSRNAR